MLLKPGNRTRELFYKWRLHKLKLRTVMYNLTSSYIVYRDPNDSDFGIYRTVDVLTGYTSKHKSAWVGRSYELLYNLIQRFDLRTNII